MKVRLLTVKINVEELEDVYTYVEAHIDENSIIGCFADETNLEDDSISVMTTGGNMTVKRDSRIMDYLGAKFPEMYDF